MAQVSLTQGVLVAEVDRALTDRAFLARPAVDFEGTLAPEDCHLST